MCARISQHPISRSTAAADCRTDAHAYPDRNTHAHAYLYPNAYWHAYQHAYRHADCDADGDACAIDCHACSTAHINTNPAHGHACATDRHAGAGPAPVRACAAARTGVRHAGRFLGWGCRVGPGIA